MPSSYCTTVTPDEIFAASHVSRFHMVRTIRPQSIAEHSYRVALLATYFCRVLAEELLPGGLRDQLLGREFQFEVLDYALIHDIDESMTGDIPSPVKAAAGPGLKEELDGLFWGSRPVPAPAPEVRWMVKLADIVEGYLFYLGNGGLGPSFPDARYNWVLDNWIVLLETHLAKGEDVFPGLGADFFQTRLFDLVVAQRLGISVSNT